MNNKDIKKMLKNAGKSTLGMVEMISGMTISKQLPFVGVPIVYDGAVRMANGMTGVKSNNSMMVTNESNIYNKVFHRKQNAITQNIPTLSQLFKALTIKDKKNFLVENELNFLLGASKLDENGQPIVYSTHSQSITKFLLRRAEKAGFIENFNSVGIDYKKLRTEKIMIGNMGKNISKKEKMYDMSFNLTDKKITDEDIKKFLRVDSLDENKFNIRRDKEGNILSIDRKLSSILKERLKNHKLAKISASQDKKLLNVAKLETIDKDKDKIKLSDELGKLVNTSNEIQSKEENSDKKQISLSEKIIE